MKTTKLLLLFILLMNGVHAQTSLFSPMRYSDGKGDTLNYQLLFPDFSPLQKYPLVIFLHGSGERGNDNVSQLKWGVYNFASDMNLKLHPAIVIAPQCPAGQGWANIKINPKDNSLSFNDTATRVADLLMSLIRSSIQKFPIDTNRIYITGLSMGGFGTFDLITRYPDFFAAAVPVCGGGDVSKVNRIKHIPMWIVHGAEDAAVDPTLSVKMLNALMKAGAKPGYSQYPEVGHFSWIGAYSDPMIMEWMFRQRKKSK